MKIRRGFVSNSSSSSFMCDVCGEDVCGYDVCLSEAEMSECVNNHIFCNSHTDAKPEPTIEELRTFCLGNFSTDDTEEREEILKMEYEELVDEAESWDYGEDDEYDVPESRCPICSFLEILPNDVYRYLLRKNGITKKAMLKRMKTEFSSYREFYESIKKD